MRKILNGSIGLLLTCAALVAGAQGYPTKPVHMVVPYPAGGYYDLLARVIGAKLGETWGQPVVVENRVGANGMVGTDFVAKGAADGYTILMGGIGPFGISPSLYRKMAYDPVRDFAPVIHVASAPNVLVVHPSVTANSVKELIALALANPGKLTFSSAGSGSSQHLSGEMMKTMAGVNMTHVPYKGSAPSVTAVLGGQVSLLFGTMADVMAHIRAGKVRALAVTSAKRIPALPEVPTMVEAGIPGYEATAWFGVFAPAATPGDIVVKLNRDIARILEMPDVLARISLQGSAEIIGGSPEQYGSFVRAEIAKWAKVVKDSGAKVD
ncbi:MAG: LacI family transcriptional regulator [Betaproteobacteria bacterium RIFCSPLOWO2_02_FULL_65_20]|nr:MAG: LacI family transcriptional regulator [Betaproteobacteria bacterium RIFCSPLOWO2_02_FULL_65_20]